MGPPGRSECRMTSANTAYAKVTLARPPSSAIASSIHPMAFRGRRDTTITPSVDRPICRKGSRYLESAVPNDTTLEALRGAGVMAATSRHSKVNDHSPHAPATASPFGGGSVSLRPPPNSKASDEAGFIGSPYATCLLLST